MGYAQAKMDAGPRRGARSIARARGAPLSPWLPRRSRALQEFASIGFIYLAALVDAVTITGAAAASSALYRIVTLGRMPPVELVTTVGVILSAIVIAARVHHGEYDIEVNRGRGRQFARSVSIWNLAFFCALALGFTTKTSGDFSRGAVGAFYAGGFVAMFAARLALVEAVEWTRRIGLIRPRRIVVVGFEEFAP